MELTFKHPGPVTLPISGTTYDLSIDWGNGEVQTTPPYSKFLESPSSFLVEPYADISRNTILLNDQILYIESLTIDSNQNIFFVGAPPTGYSNNIYIRYSNSQEIRKLLSIDLVYPAIAVDSSGRLFVSRSYLQDGITVHDIAMVTTTDGWDSSSNIITSVVTTLTSTSGGTGITVDSSGRLFVTLSSENEIRMITPPIGGWDVSSTPASNYVIANPSQTSGSLDGSGSIATFDSPKKISIDSSGRLFVSDGFVSIRMITPPTGGWGAWNADSNPAYVFTIANPSQTSGSLDGSGSVAEFTFIHDLVVDNLGRLFVNDSIIISSVYTLNLRTITPPIGGWGAWNADSNPAIVSTINSPLQFRRPGGIALGPDGVIYSVQFEPIRIYTISYIFNVDISGEFSSFGNGAVGWTGVDRLIDASGSLPPILESLSGAFLGASRLVGSGFKGWNVSDVTNMSYMFKDASGCYTNGRFRTDLSGWSVVNVISKSQFFYLNGVDTTTTDRFSPFFLLSFSGTPLILTFSVSESSSLVTLPITGIDSSGLVIDWGVAGQGPVFYNGASFPESLTETGIIKFTGNFTNFGIGGAVWNGVESLLDISGPLPSSVTDLSGAFYDASNLVGSGVKDWDVSRITDMSYMFYGTGAFNQDVSGWNVSRVRNMSHMFYGTDDFNQNLSGWNVSRVRNMSHMFYGTGAFNQDVSGWDISGVTDMASMFENASAFDKDLSIWSTRLSDLSSSQYSNWFRNSSDDPTFTDAKSPFWRSRPIGDSNTKAVLLLSGIGPDQPNPPIFFAGHTYYTSETILYQDLTEIYTFNGLTKGALYPIGNTLYGIQGNSLFSYTPSTSTVNSNVYTFIGIPSQHMTVDSSNNLYACDNSGNLYRFGSNQRLLFTDASNVIISSLSFDGSGVLFGCSSQAILRYNTYNETYTFTYLPVFQNSGFFNSFTGYKGRVYFYYNGTLQTYNFTTAKTLHTFRTTDLNGYDPVDKLYIFNDILYGICSKGGAGLGNGLYSAGTHYAFDLSSERYTVLVNYCASDSIRGATPLSFFSDGNITTIVTPQGGPNFSYRVAPRAGPTYSLVSYTINGPVPCFNKGTKILCDRNIWTPIETLRVGDLVQTYKHGLRPIIKLVSGTLINNPDVWHTCMYSGQRPGHEPLVVTGGHGFLVDYLTESQQREQAKYWETDEVIIDDMVVMIAPVSEEFTKKTDHGIYTYYHFVLKNDGDDRRRYGVFANGFLTETPSLLQLS